MGQLLDLVRMLGLDDPQQYVPPPPPPDFVGPVQPPPEPAPLTGWRGVVDRGLDTVVGGLKGLTGVGDQGPAGATPTNAGQVLGAALPLAGILGKFPRFAKALKAYHGSPHDYPAERLVQLADGTLEHLVGLPDVLPDVPPGATVVKDFPLGRQRMDKINTGEGAQAYGHGMYSAQREGTAVEYRDALAHRPIKLLDNDKLSHEQQAILDYFQKNNVSIDDQAALTVGDVMLADPTPKPRTQATHEKWQKAWADLRPRLSQVETPGKMYELNIHATQKSMLDWDKPIEQQSAKVRKALGDWEPVKPKDGLPLAGGGVLRIVDHPDLGKKYFLEMGDKRFALAEQDVNRMVGQGTEGSTAYQALSAKLGGDEAASAYLREQGVPGIRYLDQGSRAAGKGSRNFVIFDDATIEILKKYGLMLPVAGGTAAAAGMGRQQEGAPPGKQTR